MVIAPGNLYGSLLPALTVSGVKEAFAKTPAKKVVITNLVTKPGQTTGWHVVDYIRVLQDYVGDGQIDVVLYNNKAPSAALLKKYSTDGEFPVAIDPERFSEITAKAIGANLVADYIFPQDPNDKAVPRTLIRHDAAAVCEQLKGLV